MSSYDEEELVDYGNEELEFDYDSFEDTNDDGGGGVGDGAENVSGKVSYPNSASISSIAAGKAVATPDNKMHRRHFFRRLAPLALEDLKLTDKRSNSQPAITHAGAPTSAKVVEQQQQDNKTPNFFVDINRVRWFYKADKKSAVSLLLQSQMSTQSSSSSVVGAAEPQTPTPLIAASGSQSNLQTSMLVGDESPSVLDVTDASSAAAIINEHNNSVVNIHHISSKKWIEFNKLDSFNLETEYRETLGRKHLNYSSESKTVQVLDDLYEVDLETKKCYSIYWKSK